jgi:hypothetical protein
MVDLSARHCPASDERALHHVGRAAIRSSPVANCSFVLLPTADCLLLNAYSKTGARPSGGKFGAPSGNGLCVS